MQLRTTFGVYLCIERSESGAKGTSRILEGMPILGNLIFTQNYFCQNNLYVPLVNEV